MQIHEARHRSEYLDTLREKLKIRTAKDEAIEISSTKLLSGKSYNHCIRIDFIGIAATTLFDIGGRIAADNVYQSLEELLLKTSELNDEGCFVKIRLLMEYPYSVAAYTRIKAEYSRRRTSINEPQFIRGLKLTEQIDETIFGQSSYVVTQSTMLRQMQELYESLDETGLWNGDTGPNTFVIRFTPVQPGMCCLFLNNSLFFDVYTFAKEKRQETLCKSFSPVIQIDKLDDEIPFSGFEDHFRYIWDLDVTMDCQDATYFELGSPDSLSKIKPPHQIKFEAKAGRHRARDPHANSRDFNVWQSGINRMMNRLCANLSPTPSSESIFITCSWRTGDDSNSAPNIFAQELYSDLFSDLVKDQQVPIASVKILQAPLTEFLATELYSSMEDSTFGIILLTKDIISEERKSYSKPNVYHELGYLMKHLKRDRLIIIAEKGVEIPTNIQDITRLDFEPKKICFVYRDIIRKLTQVTDLDEKSFNEIMKSLLARLDKKLHDGGITFDEHKSQKDDIEKGFAPLDSRRS